MRRQRKSLMLQPVRTWGLQLQYHRVLQLKVSGTRGHPSPRRNTMRVQLGLALSILLLSGFSQAQTVQLPSRYSAIKAENGLIIGWQVSSEDRTATQVDVYDRGGRLLVGLAPLRLVPEANRATIHDVSAFPGRIIAVAAVYRKGNDSVPAGSLLYFDFQGNLLLALALAPSHGIWRLTVNADSDVWTLTAGDGDQKPSEVPMVVGYRPSGKIFKELFTRSEFPFHASDTQENETVGAAGFGHTSDLTWFWLPGSADFVTFRPDGSAASRLTTGLPQESPYEAAMRVVLTDDGTLLAQFRGTLDGRHFGHLSFFSMSKTRKRWELFPAPCVGCLLIGTDSGKAVLAKGNGSGLEIYTVPIP